MLKQIKCSGCGAKSFYLYIEPGTGDTHINCSACGAIATSFTGQASQQPAAPNPDSNEAMGGPRDEPQDLVSPKKAGRALRLPDVMKATGLAKSTIYKMMAENPPRFPRGTTLRYTKVHVWCEEVIEAYRRGQWKNGWKPTDLNSRAKTDKKEIISLFIDAGKRQSDISKLTGWSQPAVRQILTWACMLAYKNAKTQEKFIAAPFNPGREGKQTPDLSNQISCDIWRGVLKEHLGEPNEAAFRDWCKQQKRIRWV